MDSICHWHHCSIKTSFQTDSQFFTLCHQDKSNWIDGNTKYLKDLFILTVGAGPGLMDMWIISLLGTRKSVSTGLRRRWRKELYGASTAMLNPSPKWLYHAQATLVAGWQHHLPMKSSLLPGMPPHYLPAESGPHRLERGTCPVTCYTLCPMPGTELTRLWDALWDSWFKLLRGAPSHSQESMSPFSVTFSIDGRQ